MPEADVVVRVVRSRSRRWSPAPVVGLLVVRPVPLQLRGMVPPQGVRGVVAGLSFAARRRLRWLLLRWIVVALEMDGELVTLTYGGGAQPTVRERDAHLEALRKWCARSGLCGVWVRELQERGVVHLHLVVVGGVDARRLRDWWIGLTGCGTSRLDARRLRAVDVRPLVGDEPVLARYLAKGLGAASAVAETGKAGGQKSGDVGGRFWGLFGASAVRAWLVEFEEVVVRADLMADADGWVAELFECPCCPSVLVGDVSGEWLRQARGDGRVGR